MLTSFLEWISSFRFSILSFSVSRLKVETTLLSDRLILKKFRDGAGVVHKYTIEKRRKWEGFIFYDDTLFWLVFPAPKNDFEAMLSGSNFKGSVWLGVYQWGWDKKRACLFADSGEQKFFLRKMK
jgi:hypothetical protein